MMFKIFVYLSVFTTVCVIVNDLLYLFEEDEYDEIERELVYLIGGCQTAECRTQRIVGNFCVSCGTCNVISTAKLLFHQLSPTISKDYEPIPMKARDDTEEWPHLDPYSACIHNAVVACPTYCPIELLRAESLRPFVLAYNTSSEAYTIHIPEAYSCRRRKSISKLCVELGYWLGDIEDRDEDGKNYLLPPDTKICFHEDNNLFEELKEKGNEILLY